MNTPTYKEQFDKLTSAYIENRVEPLRGCACFIGNLLNGRGDWEGGRSSYCVVNGETNIRKILNYNDSITRVVNQEAGGLYSEIEIVQMEVLFVGLYRTGGKNEDALFEAFEKTLDLLKQIHISKGEVIDEVPVFQKRILQPAN